MITPVRVSKKPRAVQPQALQRRLHAGNLAGTVERLYVLRMQVFHGAATSGSRLNRPTLEGGARVLAVLVPQMLSIMIAASPSEDWGEVCFPPVEDGRDG